MTRLFIVKTLLSKQPAKRQATIDVTTDVLTFHQVKQEMSDFLGYDIERLNKWIITYVFYTMGTQLIVSGVPATGAIEVRTLTII